MLDYNMSVGGSIGRIKVPLGFEFDLREAENVTPVRKNESFCKVSFLRFRG